jgi:hypothetical protein
VESFANIATALSGSLKILRTYSGLALSTWKHRASNSGELFKTVGQVVALGFGLHGVGMIYRPAEFILGAVVVIAALEAQPKKPKRLAP